MDKQWLPVPGYEGFYEVSSQGDCRSRDRIVMSGNARRRRSGKQLAPLKFSRTGYLGYQLSRDGRVRFHLAHRLVLLAFRGEPPAGAICAHLDGCRTNNVVENLQWVTPAENQAHRVQHGTSNRGESAHQAKLTAAAVSEARALREQGWTFQRISERFGVHLSTIQHAVSGKNWGHIT